MERQTRRCRTWDLDSLHYMNERACYPAERRPVEAAVVKEPVLPLAVLEKKLRRGIPSIGCILDLFDQSEYLGEFLTLVRKFLPEHEQDIMTGPIERRVERFIRLWEPRYFPLADFVWDDLSLEQFVGGIPVDLYGLSYDQYHDCDNFRPGYIILMALVHYPYVETWEFDDPKTKKKGKKQIDDDGGRIAILDEAAKSIGKDLVGEIPPKGWQPEDLHLMTDKTKYEGVGEFADWVCGCTGCWQLDANFESYGEEDWSQEVVQGLTEQWPKVKAIQEKVVHIVDWLEDDPKTNFRELLQFLLGKKDRIVPKEQIPLPLDKKGQVKPKTLLEVFTNEEVATSDENEGESRFCPATRADLEALTRF